jgi:hypothetical protein
MTEKLFDHQRHWCVVANTILPETPGLVESVHMPKESGGLLIIHGGFAFRFTKRESQAWVNVRDANTAKGS